MSPKQTTRKRELWDRKEPNLRSYRWLHRLNSTTELWRQDHPSLSLSGDIWGSDIFEVPHPSAIGEGLPSGRTNIPRHFQVLECKPSGTPAVGQPNKDSRIDCLYWREMPGEPNGINIKNMMKKSREPSPKWSLPDSSLRASLQVWGWSWPCHSSCWAISPAFELDF